MVHIYHNTPNVNPSTLITITSVVLLSIWFPNTSFGPAFLLLSAFCYICCRTLFPTHLNDVEDATPFLDEAVPYIIEATAVDNDVFVRYITHVELMECSRRQREPPPPPYEAPPEYTPYNQTEQKK
jgi:hypothetical protein